MTGTELAGRRLQPVRTNHSYGLGTGRADNFNQSASRDAGSRPSRTHRASLLAQEAGNGRAWRQLRGSERPPVELGWLRGRRTPTPDVTSRVLEDEAAGLVNHAILPSWLGKRRVFGLRGRSQGGLGSER